MARRRGEEFPLQCPRRPKHRAGADLAGRKSGKRERARLQEWLSPIAIERCGQAIEAIETLVVSEAVKVIVVVGCERHWRTPTKAAKLTAPCEGTSAQTFGLPAFPPRGLSFGLSRRASAAPALPMRPRWTDRPPSAEGSNAALKPSTPAATPHRGAWRLAAAGRRQAAGGSERGCRGYYLGRRKCHGSRHDETGARRGPSQKCFLGPPPGCRQEPTPQLRSHRRRLGICLCNRSLLWRDFQIGATEGGGHTPGITAIRALRMQKDQRQVGIGRTAASGKRTI